MKIMLAKKEERRSETLSQGTCEDRRHCREDRNTGNCMGHQAAMLFGTRREHDVYLIACPQVKHTTAEPLADTTEEK